MRLSDFDYSLDPSLIAQHPLKRRDRARLMVLPGRDGEIQSRLFCDLPDMLDPGDLLVVNDSKVLAARLHARKRRTGGRLQLLLLKPSVRDTWEALVSGKVTGGLELIFEDGTAGRILEQCDGGRVRVRIDHPAPFEKWLEGAGRTPLPPYIKREGSPGGQEDEDRIAYQTVYATSPGSIAAPTAGLHFTAALLDRLKAKGIRVCTVTLHIGPGTFRPLKEETGLHPPEKEYARVPAATSEAILRTKMDRGAVVAVGTSTVRALESAADDLLHGGGVEGYTDLFIHPGYRFRIVDALVTNFHLPRSSLLLLACAFAGRDRLLRAYRAAMQQGYRFYSFGDAMLIAQRSAGAGPRDPRLFLGAPGEEIVA